MTVRTAQAATIKTSSSKWTLCVWERPGQTESFRSMCGYCIKGLQQGPHFTTWCLSGFVVALLHMSVDVGVNLCDSCNAHFLHPTLLLPASCTSVYKPKILTQSRWMTEQLREGSISDLLPGLVAFLSGVGQQWTVLLAHTVQKTKFKVKLIASAEGFSIVVPGYQLDKSNPP